MSLNLIRINVRAALRTQLLTVTEINGDMNQVYWEARGFTAPDEGFYYREKFAPQTSDLQTLGIGGRIRHEGMYFIDCFGPADKKSLNFKPTVDIETRGGNVMEKFTPNTHLTYNGQVVWIRRVYSAALIVTPDQVQLPITVAWFADSFNSL